MSTAPPALPADIEAGTGIPRPAAPGDALIVELPLVPTRSLSDYAIGEQS